MSQLQKRNVFLFWIGKEYKLISILRNIIYLHSTNGIGYNIILITHENINNYVNDIPEYFYDLCPAHQADFVRVNVICDYGGIWLDSDTLVLDSLDSLFDIIDNNEGFLIKQNNNILWNGIFGSEKRTPFMKEWKNKMRIMLDSTKGKIGWTDIGCKMLQCMYNLNPSLFKNYKIFEGLDNLYPVNWNNCVTEYINKPYDNYKDIIRDYQPLIVLVNSVYRALENKTLNEILNGTMPINYFINKSFENLRISKNKLYNEYQIYNYGTSDYISKSICNYGTWEPNITTLFNNIINNSDSNENNIIDIGCNIGYHSLICQKHDSIRHIYSIDANNMNIYMLKLSCLLNNISNITLINKCISDNIDYFEPKNQKLVDKVGNIGGLAFKKSTNKQGIISTTIDNLITEYNINNILIMKIDIEGGELDALKGGLNLLKSGIIKNIIIEISPIFNNDSNEILEILTENNYNLYNIPHQEIGRLNTENNLLEKIQKYPITDIPGFVSSIRQTNILAVKSDQKIVIYADWIETYLTLEPFKFVGNLEKYGWKILKLSEIDINKLKETRSIVLCVTYDSFDISQLQCRNIKLIYKIDDLYPFKNIRNTCIDAADVLIGPYQYLFKEDKIIQMYSSINTKEAYFIPYSTINSFYKNVDFNRTPTEKIFVSGSVNDVYPLRKYILKFKEYIKILEHPSYNNYKYGCINENYYKKLSEYLCCFTDASSYKYILLKVFEICSVGCLLLCQDSIKQQLRRLGFFDNINYISCNKENLESKIKWILDKNNRETVDQIRLRGMNLVRNHHHTNYRSKVFDIIVNNKYLKKTHLACFNNDLYFTPDKIQVQYINSGKAEPYSGDLQIVNNYITNTERCHTYLDIGVNIGTHSIVYSNIFKKIIAFEPDKYNYNQSKENILINNVTNVELLNKALGSQKGFIETKQHSDHSRGCITSVLTNNKTDVVKIKLDSLELNNIDFIKIDVEGNELDVLIGATKTIQRNKPIIEFEYNHLAKQFNVEYSDIDLYLKNQNYIFDKRFDDNYFYVYDTNSNKQVFSDIYKNGIWNNNNPNIPLSGPGSSLENTRQLTELLEKFIYENDCTSILDLGCGDLTWMAKTKFFLDDDIQYTGIDIVQNLIDTHKINYTNKTFLCEDITVFHEFNKVSLIIIRDVIFHLKNAEILKILNNIKNKFDFICITSCLNSENNDKFNKWRFSEKNIHIDPFNVLYTYKTKFFEKKFNRFLYIYEHSNFY